MKKIIFAYLPIIFTFATPEENITTPGLYVFGNDIISTGTLATTLVRISSNNVILDLAGHIVRNDTVTSDTTSVGIAIDPGMHDITIQNGIIGPVNGTGIIIESGTQDIALRNIQINDCNGYGLHCRGSSTERIDGVSLIDCSIEGCGISAPLIGAGLFAENTRSLFASNCYFSQNSSLYLASGIYCSECTSCDFSGCKMSNNKGGTGGIGAYVLGSSDFRFEECTILRNGCPTPSVNTIGSGIRIENSQGIMIVESTIAAAYAPSGSAINVSSINSSSIGLLDCIIIGALGGTYAAGIYSSNGSSCAIINSIVQGTTATGIAHGISYANISAGYIRSNSILNTRGATSVGIIDTTTPSASLIAENYAFNNGANYVVTYSGSVTLPLIIGGFSGSAGLPQHVSGMLDNVSVNYQATGTAITGTDSGTGIETSNGSSLIVTLTATTSLISSPLAGIGATIGIF
jgi:hypothetical protein